MVKEVCRIPLLYPSGYFSRKYELFQQSTEDSVSIFAISRSKLALEFH